MNVKKGLCFEGMAVQFLEQEGYQLKKWNSKENWLSPYDLTVEKNGQRYCVEVRGVSSDSTRLNLTKKKYNTLNNLNDPVLLVLIKPSHTKLVPLKDASSHLYIYQKSRKKHNKQLPTHPNGHIRRIISRGSFTIPKPIRDQFSLKKNSLLEIGVSEGKIVIEVLYA